MTGVRVTAAQARALGITDTPNKKARRTTRKVAAGPYRTRCTRCGEEFSTVAAEDRHIHTHHHARYEIVS